MLDGLHSEKWARVAIASAFALVGIIWPLKALVAGDVDALALLILPSVGTMALLLAGCNFPRSKRAEMDHQAALDTAIGHMSQGLVMFNSSSRLVLFNARYAELYGIPQDRLKVGLSLRDLLLLRKDSGSFLGDVDTYCKSIAANLGEGRVTSLVAQTGNGRSIQIVNVPLAQGGWLATHEDVTEKLRAEQALAAAKADAERAEREARDAHARLLDALDLVPEGLVIFDADDRYLLWNQKYAEIYGASRDLLVPGAGFEDVLRAGVKRGQYPDAIGREEEWIEERLGLHARPQSQHEQRLPGDCWCRIEERRNEKGSIGIRIDITELKQRETRFRVLFESNPVPMWVFDRETLRFLAVNDAVVQHYGYSREHFLRMTLLDIRPREDWDKLREIARSEDNSRKQRVSWRHFKADGSLIEVETYGRTIQYQGRPAVMIAVIDVTERKKAERRIAHIALHDTLTDLPNRAALDEHFSSVLKAAQDGGEFSVLCIDLDRFKEINDLYGHSVGDAVLCEISARLRQACGPSFLARVGGDEFIAIASGNDEVGALVRRLEGTAETDIAVAGHNFRLGLSIGIATYPKDGTDATKLIANADTALYRAKHEGRGTTRFFTLSMDQQLRARRDLERDLRVAIERNELSLAYQPQVRADRSVIGFEALARWRHPARGWVPPAEFIPIAEESDLIVELGEWVLREACQEAARWPQPLKLAINVSAVQFRRGDLQAILHNVLLESGVAPARIELEITEGVLIENVSRAAAILRKLKTLGVRIALDDFGTGYSSLSYLQSFPLDLIKIDRTFIGGLDRETGALAIVRAVIGLAHGLHLPVLAEGVETEHQLAVLAAEGCDEFQGYLFGRPAAIERYWRAVGRPADGRAHLRARTG